MEQRTVADSLTLNAALQQFQDTTAKLTWNRRRKLPGKMLLAAFLAMFIKENSGDASKNAAD